jgi:hypothetical protein
MLLYGTQDAFSNFPDLKFKTPNKLFDLAINNGLPKFLADSAQAFA